MAKTFLTQEGYDKLLKELHELKEEKLPHTLEKLKEAIAQWDISENAEYDSAMSERELIEARIKEIENMLKDVEIIKEQKWWEIRYGSTVVLKDEKGKTYEWKIVGDHESDVLDGTISFKSPLGSAIQWKKKWDTATVNAPQKKYKVTIVEVK